MSPLNPDSRGRSPAWHGAAPSGATGRLSRERPPSWYGAPAPRPRLGFGHCVTAPTLVGMGALFWALIAIVYAVMGNTLYLGFSSHTTGTIIDSPTDYPTIRFDVGGQTYTFVTGMHGMPWTLGQDIAVAYNPRAPWQAETVQGRWVGVVFVAVAAVLIGLGLIFAARAWQVHRRQRRVVEEGQCVEGRITAVTQNPGAHTPTRWLTHLTLTLDTPGGGRRTVRSTGHLRRKGLTLADLPVTTLPVYIDWDRPDKYYYVDDSTVDG